MVDDVRDRLHTMKKNMARINMKKKKAKSSIWRNENTPDLL